MHSYMVIRTLFKIPTELKRKMCCFFYKITVYVSTIIISHRFFELEERYH